VSFIAFDLRSRSVPPTKEFSKQGSNKATRREEDKRTREEEEAGKARALQVSGVESKCATPLMPRSLSCPNGCLGAWRDALRARAAASFPRLCPRARA